MTQKPNRKLSTQAYLNIAVIKNSVVVLKDGGLRAILQVNSVNFALKSPQEQESIILRYQGFLNSLNIPIQILMQSRRLDLTDYLTKLKLRSQQEVNPKMRQQILIYVDFMSKLVDVANIMDKRFYVVVPYDPIGLKQRGFFDRLLHPAREVTISMTEEEFQQYSAELTQRVNLIGSGLANMGLTSIRLTTKQIIELLYATYNPEEATLERLSSIESMTSGTVYDHQAQATESSSPK